MASRTDPLKAIELAALAGLAYVAYQILGKAGGAISAAANQVQSTLVNATNAVATPLANAYVNATTGGAQANQLQGSVILSDGTEVPLSQISSSLATTGTGVVTFNYGGQVWQMTGPADDTGSWHAVPAPFGVTGSGW